MLWQLFVATSNHFSRTLDRNRLHASDEKSMLEQVSRSRKTPSNRTLNVSLKVSRGAIWRCTPRRKSRAFCDLSKIERCAAADRADARAPRIFAYAVDGGPAALFSTISGVLAAWGMNIIKADAFANAAGVVLDTFHFADLHRTLELNPTEIDRFVKSLHDVLQNKAALEPLLQSRDTSEPRPSAKSCDPDSTQLRRIRFRAQHAARSNCAGPPRPPLRHGFRSGASCLQH